MTFLTRDGCHLCEQAAEVLAAVSVDIGLRVDEVDIDGDDELTKLWGLRVPVILASHDRVIAEGIIDDKRTLKADIKKALAI
ncbi:MAG TPA: glutaredoxin family protein [Acidimicrobiia bacterium]|nr:glutaredoxin family protein [Acidimicrobiia bacterium]